VHGVVRSHKVKVVCLSELVYMLEREVGREW